MSLETETEITQEVAAPEVETPVEQETAEASPQNDDAAFLAGFKGVTEGTSDVGATPEQEPEVAPEPEPEPVKLIAGYTEDQLRDLLSKASEVDRLKASEAKLFGTLGSMKQAIDAMRTQQPTATAQFSKERFKRLHAEFPEMAEMLAEDLSGISLPQQAGLDISAVEGVINERIEAVKRDQATKLLGVVHRDWRQVVQEPEFETWKGSLAPEAQDVLDNGWDAELIAEGLTAFKEWKTKAAQTKVSKQSRLEAAVAPKTTARVAPVQTDEDAFLQGFKEARGIR